MALKQIKVFGERNTGTRAVIRMIDAAAGLRGAGHPGVSAKDLEPYRQMAEQLEEIMPGAWKKVYREAVRDVQDDAMGPVGAWKHAAPIYGSGFLEFDIRVLFMVRNPYSWALSLFKRPYHYLGQRRDEFEEFLVFPWLTMGRDRVDKILGSPMDLWTLKLEAYQFFEERAREAGTPCATLKFEDFVNDPVSSLGGALGQLVEEPVVVEELTVPTKKNGLKAAERRAYYANEEWRSGLTASAVSIMNNWIDWRIAEKYGYPRLDPADFPDSMASD